MKTIDNQPKVTAGRTDGIFCSQCGEFIVNGTIFDHYRKCHPKSWVKFNDEQDKQRKRVGGDEQWSAST